MFVIKSLRFLKNFKIRSSSYSGLTYKFLSKTEGKSCWAVPLIADGEFIENYKKIDTLVTY
jgi:hypothetical protein